MPEALTLRWGCVADRVAMGATLTIAGAIAVAGSTAYVPWLAILGTLAHVGGWLVLPAPGGRRVAAAILSTAAVWMLLIGPRASAVVAVCFCCWLLVRRRSRLAWLTALLPLAAGVTMGILLPADMAGMLPAIADMAAAVCGAAWLAASIDGAGRSRGALPADHQAPHPADS